MPRRKVLVIGYGNPARSDDGLGPALAARLETMGLAGVTVDADYQLTVEDAALVAEHDEVIFVDAALLGPEPYEFRAIEPSEAGEVSSHRMRPEVVLGLAQRLLGAAAQGYVLAIRGYEFEPFREALSPTAQGNLESALEFIVGRLQSGECQEE